MYLSANWVIIIIILTVVEEDSIEEQSQVTVALCFSNMAEELEEKQNKRNQTLRIDAEED